MNTPIFILPSSKFTGLRMLASSIAYALQQKGLKIKTFHPVFDMDMTIEEIEKYLLNDRVKDYVELVLQKFYEKAQGYDFAIVCGLFRQTDYTHKLYSLNGSLFELNRELIKALSAKVIISSYHGNKTLQDINDEMEYKYRTLPKKIEVLGAIITKVNAPYDEDGHIGFSLTDEETRESCGTVRISPEEVSRLQVFSKPDGIRFLGCVDWSKEKTYPRILDIKNRLKLELITDVTLDTRVHRVTMCSRNIENFIEDLEPNTMVITSADRSDILMAVCLAAYKGMKIAGIVLTVGKRLNDDVKRLCLEIAEKSGLAILTTENRSTSTIVKITELDFMGIPKDDFERIQRVKDSIIASVNIKEILKEITKDSIAKNRIMSPPAFRYHLLKMAQKAKKKIVLPESYEPRTLQAAKNCYEQGIADCVLIGDKTKINEVAHLNGFSLPEGITVIEIDEASEKRYLKTLLDLRKHKGLSENIAKDAIKNPIILATIMLYLGEVDGLVSGAEHTTADVLRPALQLVKTKPGISLVSSVFFMCMPEEVIVFADCAVNQDPTAEQLVEIAIQSAESAQKFSIEPRIAMISYSTGTSGSGEQVEKVRKATEMLKNRQPELLVDGPLQYDAAMIESVAKKKAPGSPVAGKATVLIFPDLNTGNTVYKAVQRSANVLSIGPVLQGINKPVNDLSRGATVDDITYTIAITAIQAI